MGRSGCAVTERGFFPWREIGRLRFPWSPVNDYICVPKIPTVLKLSSPALAHGVMGIVTCVTEPGSFTVCLGFENPSNPIRHAWGLLSIHPLACLP